MSRREKLIEAVIGPEMDQAKARMLNATLRLILGDMGQMYCKFWEAEGPGVLCIQPAYLDRPVIFLTLKELHAAQEESERENNGDLAETFRRVLSRAQKIDPKEKAGYLISDNGGLRYFEIDYNKVEDGSALT
jgi:hypothetical protein